LAKGFWDDNKVDENLYHIEKKRCDLPHWELILLAQETPDE
jgi:hypothetical protein